jgi:hypothetical protein
MQSTSAIQELFDELRHIVVQALREEWSQLAREDPDRLVNAEDAGRLLGMTTRAVQKAAERGTIPARHIGRRLRFRVGDLVKLGRDDAE